MNVVDYANAGFVTENEQEDANIELSIKLHLLIRTLWDHCEGISRDDIKLLCLGCNIDSRAILGEEPSLPAPTPHINDMNLPF